MGRRVLITGGAGFIGSYVCDELLQQGYEVRVYDVLDRQVHPTGQIPSYLNPGVEMMIGDVRDRDHLAQALRDVEAVIHLAAAVGVGQSMYEIVRYTSVNNEGTATLLELLTQRPVEQLVVASSMSIYGEGEYRDASGNPYAIGHRPLEQLRQGNWELLDEQSRALQPVPTSERKQPEASSVYALSKFDQERLCLIVGQAYGMATTALRLFNVFGPRQALSNPYTGVMAIFASRFLNGLPPLIYEDGQQQRDFVNVRDVARAFRLALERPEAAGHAINIGSGQPITINKIAERMAHTLGCEEIQPQVTGRYRAGDVRHCFADISLARELLGFHPQVTFEDGLVELATWLSGQAADDHVEEACDALRQKGLLV